MARRLLSPEKWSKTHEELTYALGHICIEWGQLERTLTRFIWSMAPLAPLGSKISQSITAGMDARTKIQIIKAIGFVKKPSVQWYRRLVRVLDYIDNDLRVRRNRCIHDAWEVRARGLNRIMHQIKFEKPQSFKLVLHTEQTIPVSISEIKKLCDELYDLRIVMTVVWLKFVAPEQKLSLPPRFFQRFLRRSAPSRRRKNVGSKQRPRQKSSPKTP